MMFYLSAGAKTLINLALLDIFKNKYGIEPATEEQLESIILLPWSFKLVYGIFCDLVPLLGSRRKNYLILISFMQFVSYFCIALIPFKTAGGVAGCAFLVNLC